MIDYLTNDTVLLEWVFNFALASTLLLGSVWLAEKMGFLKNPDLSDTLWRVAILGAFIAAFPTTMDFGQKIGIETPLAASSNTAKSASSDKFTPFLDPKSKLLEGRKFKRLEIPKYSFVNNSPKALDSELKSSPGEFVVIEKSPTLTASKVGETPIFTFVNSNEMAGASQEDTFSMTAIGFGLWAIISGLLILKLMVSFVLAVKGFGERTPVSYEHRVHNLLARLCAKAGVRNVPLLTTSSNIWSPACLPGNEICIPEWALNELDDDKITSLLAHEMGHIVRHDPWMIIILQFLSKIFFFQPLFGLAEKRMKSLAELGADQWAAENTKDARSLANTLYACAKKITINQQPQWGVTMAKDKSELKNRIGRLIGGTGHSIGKAPKALILVSMVGLAFALPQFQITATAESQNPFKEFATWKEEAHEQLEGAHAQLEVSRLAMETHVAELSDGISTSILNDPDDDSGTFKMTGFGSRIEITWDGKFGLSDDERSIGYLEEDGFLDISTGRGSRKISMEFENVDGELVGTYFEGRDEMPFDEDAELWLAETLTTFIQKSGFFAEERVAKFLEQGGVGRVLEEIEKLESDYIVRTYGYELLDQAKLSVTEIDEFVEVVSDVDSDYEMRMILSQLLDTQEVSSKTLPSLLKAVSTMESDYEVRTAVLPLIENMDFDDESTAIFLDLTESIDSDYEFRVVIENAMDKANLEPIHVSRILEIASDRIDSDYEMRQVLAFTTSRLGGPETTRPALKAVESISSDYEKRLSLLNIIENTQLDPVLWERIIDQASTIRSDYEKAQTFTVIAEEMPMEPVLIEFYKNSVDLIGSEHERNKAKLAIYERAN